MGAGARRGASKNKRNPRQVPVESSGSEHRHDVDDTSERQANVRAQASSGRTRDRSMAPSFAAHARVTRAARPRSARPGRFAIDTPGYATSRSPSTAAVRPGIPVASAGLPLRCAVQSVRVRHSKLGNSARARDATVDTNAGASTLTSCLRPAGGHALTDAIQLGGALTPRAVVPACVHPSEPQCPRVPGSAAPQG